MLRHCARPHTPTALLGHASPTGSVHLRRALKCTGLVLCPSSPRQVDCDSDQPPVKTACINCRRAKVKCIFKEGEACARCARVNIACTPHMPIRKRKRGASATFSSHDGEVYLSFDSNASSHYFPVQDRETFFGRQDAATSPRMTASPVLSGHIAGCSLPDSGNGVSVYDRAGILIGVGEPPPRQMHGLPPPAFPHTQEASAMRDGGACGYGYTGGGSYHYQKADPSAGVPLQSDYPGSLHATSMRAADGGRPAWYPPTHHNGFMYFAGAYSPVATAKYEVAPSRGTLCPNTLPIAAYPAPEAPAGSLLSQPGVTETPAIHATHKSTVIKKIGAGAVSKSAACTNVISTAPFAPLTFSVSHPDDRQAGSATNVPGTASHTLMEQRCVTAPYGSHTGSAASRSPMMRESSAVDFGSALALASLSEAC